jgi:hypothetical protein
MGAGEQGGAMRLERREAKRRIEQRRLGAAGRRIADGRPTITDLQRMSAQEYIRASSTNVQKT